MSRFMSNFLISAGAFYTVLGLLELIIAGNRDGLKTFGLGIVFYVAYHLARKDGCQ